MRTALMLSLMIVAGATVVSAQAPYVGNYATTPRVGAHVDCEALVEGLQELGANTYMWLIWHSPNDWEDLHTFLPLAEEAGITVWAYLVPPSETPAFYDHFPYSEPFRLDYVRWAEEIAKLSLEHENLVGYVIDDFWYNVNPDWFSAEYIEEMIEAGRAINPRIKFYPLMYYHQIGAHFAELLGPMVDGVVAAYPRDRAEIEDALRFLRDDYAIASRAVISFPWGVPSTAGDHGFLSTTARVTDPDNARLRLRHTDDFKGPTEGYHFMQARVDGRVVWEKDVAGDDDGLVEIDLREHVADRDEVNVALGVHDRRGVTIFGVQVGFPEVEATGLELPAFDEEDAWEAQVRGAFSVSARPRREGAGQFELPLIVMTAASPGEYEMRNDEVATPERIAGKVEWVLEMVREGQIAGLVTYCLNMDPESADFKAVAEVIDDFRREFDPGGGG